MLSISTPITNRFTDDSYSFTLRLLEEAGVAITPGIDFGQHQPHRHVRFAYTSAIPQLAEGVERLRQFLKHGGESGYTEGRLCR
ncbi:MAG: hypothetical protein U1F42_01465 [Candidatus Competibacteraceae bacterium]